MNRSVFLLSMMLTLCLASAQQAPATEGNYHARLIQSFSSSRWMIGDKILRTGELRALLRDHPASAGEYKKHRRNRLLTNVLFVGAGALYIAGFFVLEDDGAAIGMLGGTVALTLGSIAPAVTADRSLHKSIRLYNRAVLSGDSARAK